MENDDYTVIKTNLCAEMHLSTGERSGDETEEEEELPP